MTPAEINLKQIDGVSIGQKSVGMRRFSYEKESGARLVGLKIVVFAENNDFK